MVNKFNKLAADAKLPDSQIYAVVGNLMDDTPNPAIAGPEWYSFDVAAIGLGFHHFERRPEMLHRLAERLKPGGVLLILDFLIGEGVEVDDPQHWHRASHGTIAVPGFTEESMRDVYQGAGLDAFEIRVFPEKVRMEFGDVEKFRTVFLAKGRKPH